MGLNHDLILCDSPHPFMQTVPASCRNCFTSELHAGTFDVSVLTIDGGIFEVNSTGGNTRLGGEDFDAKVVEYLWQTFQKAHKGAVLTGRAQRRLFIAAERAKRQLSAATTTDVEVEAFYEREGAL